ncbi:hypothetical protein ESB00_05700 [Oleiharenicola lentus]|uniref:Uncharacterized protein n=1 Tax=Oleiharenicola lentus TaxID=2508720 RepID=A0A4Q1C975_9BACT|nr:hypothetical protein [Oleiharenicola lentus]RXK55392.1 hypothetical protein ESB00_05700 [Oleiharenicola lentus]
MVILRMLRPVWFLSGWLMTGAPGLHADDTVPASTVTQPAERPTLSAAQTDQLAALAAEELSRPAPKPRPRLKEGDVLSEQGRLRVHGGMSVTVGASSQGSFYGTSGWVGFHDPVTGLSVSFSYSSYKGDGLGGYYPGYGYPLFYPSVGPVSEALPAMRAMPFVNGERGGRR